MELDHWYYVVATFEKVGTKTTINCYVADLTTGSGVQHTLKDQSHSGQYINSSSLGVGVAIIGTGSQYVAPCDIDEVALYNTILDINSVQAHLDAINIPFKAGLVYRELFPCDTRSISPPLPVEGWQVHVGEQGKPPSSGVQVANSETAFDADYAAVASHPQDTGVTRGYLFKHAGTDTNILYWTEEFINPLQVSWLKYVTMHSRCAQSYPVRLALRVDVNNTPDNTADDPWFVTSYFGNSDYNSVMVLPYSPNDWQLHWFDVKKCEWTDLELVPRTVLEIGEVQTALPESGQITAFGLFQDYHTHQANIRVDNFSLYAWPTRHPFGTLLMLR